MLQHNLHAVGVVLKLNLPTIVFLFFQRKVSFDLFVFIGRDRNVVVAQEPTQGHPAVGVGLQCGLGPPLAFDQLL